MERLRPGSGPLFLPFAFAQPLSSQLSFPPRRPPKSLSPRRRRHSNSKH
jgi:hypothetical protein